MASLRQITANRRNAAKGGPRTPEGRAAVRFNALAHGLAAVETVLPGEDANAFEELQRSLKHDLAPANQYEQGLAEEVARCYWRLLRLRGIETSMLAYHIEARQKLAAAEGQPELSADRAVAEALINEPCDKFRNYFRYDAGIERSYYRALQQIERAQATRRKLERELPQQQSLTAAAGVGRCSVRLWDWDCFVHSCRNCHRTSSSQRSTTTSSGRKPQATKLWTRDPLQDRRMRLR
jgi:hypothetical protein